MLMVCKNCFVSDLGRHYSQVSCLVTREPPLSTISHGHGLDGINGSRLFPGAVDTQHEKTKAGTGAMAAAAGHRQRQKSRDEIALVALLKSCTKNKNLQKGSKVHAGILERGLFQNIFIGNTLVNMYAKCGALADAQEVFDELPNRDVVSWNALAAGCAQHGLDELSFTCFERMHNESLIPDAVTVACILKSCGNTRAAERGRKLHVCILSDSAYIAAADDGKDVHVKMAKRGLLGSRAVLDSALLDMYAKCGAIEMAKEVFDELTSRDVVSWTALMGGYCEKGLGEEALVCYEQMQEEGISPDAVTFAYILKACGSVRAADKGIEIHAEIARRQLLDKDVVLASALVDMYAKCGVLGKTQEAFSELPVQDVVSWTSLIGGYCKHGYSEQALDCYEKIKHKDFSFDAVTFACLLKACGNVGALEKGEEIHAETVRKGLLGKGTVLDGALLDMYNKCGVITKAQQAFEELTTRDLVSWTVLISGYCEQGCDEKALACFKQMQSEGFCGDEVTLSCILKACGSIGAVELGQEIHTEIDRRCCLRDDIVLGNALVDMYAKCGALAKAQQVFDTLRNQDRISWTTLISGYCEHGHGKEALYFFEEMKQEGLSPNVVTFVSTLKACGSVKEVHFGSHVHAAVVGAGSLADNSVLGNALVDMYAKCGAFVKARQAFDELSSRDIISWNSIISMCNGNGLFEEAIDYYERMICDGANPDLLTFTYILKACGTIGAIEKGRGLHSELVTRGLLEGSSVLGNCLVDMYAKCGVIGRAQQVFDKLPVRDVVSWNSLMYGYCQHGLTKQLFSCLDRMKDDGVSPDKATLACILKANGSRGATDQSYFFFTNMNTTFSMIPTAEHHSCMVSLFGRVGLFGKALSVIWRVQAFDYLPAWIALLRACQSWGNLKLGRFAFEHAARLNGRV